MALDLIHLDVEEAKASETTESPVPAAESPTPESFNSDRLKELSNPEYLDLVVTAQPDLPSKVRGLNDYVSGLFAELSTLPVTQAASETERILKSWVPDGMEAARSEAEEAAALIANPLSSASDRSAALGDHKRALAALGLATLAAGAAFAIPLPERSGASGSAEGARLPAGAAAVLFGSPALVNSLSSGARRVSSKVLPRNQEDTPAPATNLINNISPFIFK